MKILFLASDAFGARGGIALYNRVLIEALSLHPDVNTIAVLVRNIQDEPGDLPQGVEFVRGSAGGGARYVWHALRLAATRSFDLIICGHINFVPLARVLRAKLRAPIWLQIHGVEAWQPTGRKQVDRGVRSVDGFVSITELTRRRFLAWSGVSAERGRILTNAIRLDRYSPGPKSAALLERYGFTGRTVLLTVGRLDAAEAYKGVDEVLEILPDLSAAHPEVAYLIVGDGTDRERLEAKASTLGLSDRVRFAGYVAGDEMVDHFRIADAFVMPGRGEGFGFVFVEAMACGIPVVASKLDGSFEAVRGGELGVVVDPDDLAEVRDGILEALRRDRTVPPGLGFYSFSAFTKRAHGVLESFFSDQV